MHFGRSTDLIIASAADADWEMAPVLEFPERLAIESGRPVLLIPNDGTFDADPKHAVIAWNGGREAARAAFDALSLLDPATRLTVLMIDDGDAGETAVESAGRFADTARRHGFESADVHRAGTSGRTIGEAITIEAASLGADLLVMGAYGHSRFREFVFGGATRHVTHQATIPTLLSH